MSDQPNQSNNAPSTNPRRMSITDMFNRRPSMASGGGSSPPNADIPITPDSAHHRRGMSVSTLGLAGSAPGQTSPFTAFAKQRRASVSTSSASGSPEFRNSFGDEPAVIEEEDSGVNPPPSPFARRVSFGAQALRDVRQGGPNVPGRGRRPSSSLFTLNEGSDRSAPLSRRSQDTGVTGGEGFNWSEALRDRTKRSPSFSSGNPFTAGTNRAKSMGAATAIEPPKEMPKAIAPPTKMKKKPDHMGERMLRGDFMMD